MHNSFKIQIKGTGSYLPTHRVTSENLDSTLGKPRGWVEEKSGVIQRYFASPEETTSFMATKAAAQALAQAHLSPDQLDCIIGACGVMEQPIPSTACLVQKKLGLADSGISCFDINSTCLSFLTAFEIASNLIQTNRFRHVLIVSSDIPSLGLNWNDFKSSLIFGDGAAAVVLSTPVAEEGSQILGCHMETYSSGAHYCQVQAGGTRLHPSHFSEDLKQYALFDMDGKKAFRLSSEKIQRFLDILFSKANLTLKDIDWIIPHQASQLAMHHLRKKLCISEHKLVDIFAHHGNQVAASLPTALHYAISSEKLRKGDKVLLIGTAAGISLGGIILEY